MNLQEIAFMVNLIISNYRRRLLYLYINLILAIVPALIIVFYRDSSLVVMWCGVICVLASGYGFVKYAIHPNTFDDTPSLPWTIKKWQMKALRELAEGKQDFAELRRCPALHEYFEMY